MQINHACLGSVIDLEVDEKYFFSEKAVQGMLNAKKDMNKGRAQDLNKPCNTVGSHLAKVSLTAPIRFYILMGVIADLLQGKWRGSNLSRNLMSY